MLYLTLQSSLASMGKKPMTPLLFLVRCPTLLPIVCVLGELGVQGHYEYRKWLCDEFNLVI